MSAGASDLNAAPESRDLRVDESGTLSWNETRFPCALGQGGVRRDKIEGDGATPLGMFPLRRVLYRPDRMAPPRTALPLAPLSARDGWCNDATHPLYNHQVRQPVQASCELLWRTNSLYDVIVVLGHNDNPVVPGAGSAVSLHILDEDFKPTNGGVTLRLADIMIILGGVHACARLSIQTSV